MQLESRRSFHRKLVGALASYSLIEMLFTEDLLADAVKPIIRDWMADLYTLTRDLKEQRLKDVVFQGKLEELYRRVNLPELLRFVELDRVAEKTKLPENGAANLGVDLSKLEGMPGQPVFGKQVFGVRKGRSIVPHGHNNMCTGFIVLRGDFHGRHYDRVEDNADHYLIRPTIDRRFKPGECSTVSDHKDNVHWFKGESETGFIFNIHVLGYNKENPNSSGRVYVDPEGEKTAGGLIVAKKITSRECHRKYG